MTINSTQDAHDWEDGNGQYLTASLAWLRLRLKRLMQAAAPASVVVAEHSAAPQPVDGRAAANEQSGLLDRLRRPNGAVAQPRTGAAPQLLPPPAAPNFDELIANAAAARERAAGGMTPPPALVLLARQLGLSDFERDTLLLCAAMELDTRIATLCAQAQGDANRAYPTFALALALFDDGSWDALSPFRPLRNYRLIEINQPGATPLTASPLRADERVTSYLKGLNFLDDRLSLLLTPVRWSDQVNALAPSQLTVVQAIAERWQSARADAPLPVTQLLGADTLSKEAIAAAAAGSLGRSLYRIAARALPQQAAELESFTRLWQRESTLLPLALFIDAQAGDVRNDELAAALERALARQPGLGVVFLSLREASLPLAAPSMVLDTARPTPLEQRDAWARALGETAPPDESMAAAQLLAAQFDMNLPEIERIAVEAVQRADAKPGTPLTHAGWDACRAVTRPRLDALAQRIDVKASWDDLVLPAEPARLLRQIAAQAKQRMRVYGEWGFGDKMNRGMGITALFAGSSGTGKTMAAEVIANELRLHLYRIDLSAVVSKYIGETEKNLRQVFDAAEHGGALLFFDEADSLFGKRSEVKDSHDRYANIEINYLLQRMESFTGLAVLATNMKSALDDAFVRRLRFIVEFPYPGQAERKRMWERAFPASTPTDAIDFARLARLNLSGGNIHSIALNAAFIAAESPAQRVDMPAVMEAARAELRKLGKPVSEAELRL